MEHPESEYLRGQLLQHSRRFFAEEATSALESETVQFLPYADASSTRGKQIAIPVDVPIPPSPTDPWKVDFNGTVLTLWNRIPKPDDPHWRAIPHDSQPVWYQHASGALIPAWNLFSNLFDLLTFGEESRTPQRDQHGRFSYRFSPRLNAGLLTVPAFNESAALLAASAISLPRMGQPSMHGDFLSGPPVVVLSHDCDILKGNDFITQAVRLVRIPQPITRGRLPRVGNLWWIARNAMTPRRYYASNVTGMMELERCFSYHSTFYWLNGTGGRFGARSPVSEIARLMKQLSPGWESGIHYNYDTFLDKERFAAQLAELQELSPHKVISGRAHYLRFDPFRSFDFIRQFGITVDESSGWADFVGYRNGLAGCFQPFDATRKRAMDMWEVPMVVMDLALATQHGPQAIPFVEQQLRHLSRIGGALTILFHPGQFFNPEHRITMGLYHDILKACRDAGVRSLTARELATRQRA